MNRVDEQVTVTKEVILSLPSAVLAGELQLPEAARGLVLFAHNSGQGRYNPHQQLVAQIIRRAGIGTLLLDLLTSAEDAIDQQTHHLRFDIALLARRLLAATGWIRTQPETAHLRVGYFGISTGAGAALLAAAELDNEIGAVISRSGRPDLAGAALAQVTSPTLLVVGEADSAILQLNREALAQLRCVKELLVVPGANHFFEEPDQLTEVAQLAVDWCLRFLCT
ncbi:MAG: alpha/beta hydrolase [Acidobacteria bacterium]|nr:alpha/beta hydrolase [Acidobacteriota bacterium]